MFLHDAAGVYTDAESAAAAHADAVASSVYASAASAATYHAVDTTPDADAAVAATAPADTASALLPLKHPLLILTLLLQPLPLMQNPAALEASTADPYAAAAALDAAPAAAAAAAAAAAHLSFAFTVYYDSTSLEFVIHNMYYDLS